MTVLYVLAHFDDEALAAPLIRRAAQAGQDQLFLYVADYRRPGSALRRLAESRRFLSGFGIAAGRVTHLGAETGWWDGELHRHATPAYERLRAAAPPGLERIVTAAWEGGHQDHDICAAMAVKLAAERGGVPVDQFSLYHGKGMPWIAYRGASPLAENGPVQTVRLSAQECARWLGGLAAFRSQVPVWAGLLPATTLTLLRQGEFRYQSLRPERIGERPHAGALHYERMFKTPYGTVRRAVDALAADGLAPWTPSPADPA